MNSFFNLTKINFINIIKSTFGKNSKSKTRFSIFFPFFLLVLLFICMCATYFPMASALSLSNTTHFIFFQAGFSTLLFVLIIVSFSSNGYLFKSKDYEMLTALPIKTTHIVMAKITSVLAIGYLFSIVIFVPAIICYFIYEKLLILNIILAIIGFIFVPLIPTLLGILIGLIIAKISTHVKHKNLFSIVLSFVFLIGYFYFYFNIDKILSLVTKNGENLLSATRFLLPSITLYINGFILKNILDSLLLIIISLSFAVIVIFLLTINYNNINKRLKSSSSRRIAKSYKYKEKSILATLLIKECKTYLNYPTWVVNTAIGLFFAIGVPIAFKLGTLDMFGIFNIPITIILPILITTMLCMGNTTCASISAEGRNFYLLKSIPVDTKTIFFSKILFNILLCLPFSLISSILSIILFNDLFNILTIIFILLTPIIVCSSISVFGLLINLLFPKLEWQNISEIVKSGTPILIVTMGSMVLNIIYFILIIVINLKSVASLLLYNAIYVILLLISLIVLFKKGKHLINKI